MEMQPFLRQIIGYGLPFGVLILLTMAVNVDGQASTIPSTQSAAPRSPTSGPTTERVSTELATPHSPAKPSAVPLSQSTSAAQTTSLKATSTEPDLQDSITTEHENTTNNITGTHPSTGPAISLATVGQKFATSPTTKAAVVEEKNGSTSGMESPLSTTTAPHKTATGSSSSGLKPRSKPKQTTKGEAKPSLAPEQDVLNDTKTSDNGTHQPPQWPSTTTAVAQTLGASLAPRASPGKKSQSGIIVAALFCAVLVLILLISVFFCWRKRRSGSTSFNGGWAGQVPLPDDSALDRDVEQGAAPAKEEETRRNTLITFSGKRQSRVPSVAMEEMSKKGEQEENQKLLCGDAGGGSSPEASGQANGKLPESTAQTSQKTVFPPPPANQE